MGSAEYLSAGHAAQTRFAIFVGTADTNFPAGQSDTSVQAPVPPAENVVPSTQAVHFLVSLRPKPASHVEQSSVPLVVQSVPVACVPLSHVQMLAVQAPVPSEERPKLGEQVVHVPAAEHETQLGGQPGSLHTVAPSEDVWLPVHFGHAVWPVSLW